MSQITIINQTEEETVRVAVFQKPIIRPRLPTIAWQIAAPPPGGKSVIPIAADYTIFARYSMDPNRPDAIQNTTNTISFTETTARFDIESHESQDRRAHGAVVEQKFNGLVLNEVRVTNNFGMGVWGHIQKDGTDVFAPQVIWPGAVLMEDLRSKLYLAVVNGLTWLGDNLVPEEISLTETPILEDQVATVTGSMWKGYSIAVSGLDSSVPAPLIPAPAPEEVEPTGSDPADPKN